MICTLYAIVLIYRNNMQEEDEHKTGVVVKWFFNRGPSYVYQWIYGMQ